MKNLIGQASFLIALFVLTGFFGCQDGRGVEPSMISSQPNPASDLTNAEGWVLNSDMSDEFDQASIDTKKWFVEGQNGDYYIWKGRPPSQFAAHNAIVV